jgi:non-heme chloroperoxidase
MSTTIAQEERSYINVGQENSTEIELGGGEVARYIGRYGPERVSKAVFMAAVPPFLLKTADNPNAVDGSVFDGIKKGIAAGASPKGTLDCVTAWYTDFR